jgi:hypothetical protein
MLLIRVACFTLAVLLLTETIGTNWGWYLALGVFGMASFNLINLVAAFISFWLMTGVFEPGDAWHTTLCVFTLVALLQGLIWAPRVHWQTVRWEFSGPSDGRRRGWRRE